MKNSNQTDKKIYPIELTYSKKNKELNIIFSDKKEFRLSAEYLRVSSPSAEVQTHNPETRVFVPGKKYVDINKIEKVGNYAVRILFNDSHDTGIYSWEYLYSLAINMEKNWQEYLIGINKLNLSRDLG